MPPDYPLPMPTSEWSWSSTGDRGVYWLNRDGEQVGSVTLLPGHIEHEATLLDGLVELINTRH